MCGVWQKNNKNNSILIANFNKIKVNMTRMTINN